MPPSPIPCLTHLFHLAVSELIVWEYWVGEGATHTLKVRARVFKIIFEIISIFERNSNIDN